MAFTIYNAVKNTEEEKEKDIDELMQKADEAVKVVEKDMLAQKENLQKRLAERGKVKEMGRSMSNFQVGPNSLNLGYYKEGCYGNEGDNSGYGSTSNNKNNSSLMGGISSKEAISIQSRKQGLYNKLNSSLNKSRSGQSIPIVNSNLNLGTSLMKSGEKGMSGGMSTTTTG